jgi:hypothetical protein
MGAKPKTKTNMKTVDPMDHSIAVKHPRYSDAIRLAAHSFLATVPEGVDGRSLLSLLSFGTEEAIKEAGIQMWDALPEPPRVANIISILARQILAWGEHEVALAKGEAPVSARNEPPAPDPIAETMKAAGLGQEDIDAVKAALPPELRDIVPDSVKIQIVGKKKGEDSPSHGLPPTLYAAMTAVIPGIVIVDRKVISTPDPNMTSIAQEALDGAIEDARKLGLID